MTGLQSQTVFDALLKYLCAYEEDVCIVFANTDNQHWTRFSREDQLFITLSKLRTGHTDTEMAVEFNVSLILTRITKGIAISSFVIDMKNFYCFNFSLHHVFQLKAAHQLNQI